MKLRFAEIRDADAMLQIYAQYIHTPVTFEYRPPSLPEFTQRISEITAVYPWLAAEEDGRLVGYAYAHRQQARAAYQWNAELSIYLDRAYTSMGFGRRLYGALIETLRIQGIRTVYGVVTLPNEKSVRLHLGMGFRQTGTFCSTGYKCGRWHDVGWFEKRIAPCAPDPSPLVPVGAIEPDRLGVVLEKFSG